MPAAVAIPAAISAGSSILGGVLGSNAANRAGQIQSAAAQKQADDFKALMAQYLPGIGTAGTQAATDVTGATQAGQAGIGGAVTSGQGRISDATAQALSFLQPYIGAGGGALTTLQSLMAPGGDLNKTFTAADMQAYDPGYAFRIAQANKALTGSAAARGGALGGGTTTALASLNQNLASSEFANAEQRFRAQQQQRYSMLSGLAGMGETAANQAGGFGMQGANLFSNLGLTGATSSANLGLQGATTAGQFTTNAAQQQAQDALAYQQQIANLLTGGAAAQAAGTVGSANAWGGALSGVGGAANQVGNWYQGQQNLKTLGGFMRNPAMTPTWV